MSQTMSQTMFRGLLVNGFDYDKQAWVVNAKYVRCGHPKEMQCKCYGRLHEGELLWQTFCHPMRCL